jgi:anti-anti-sigma regulatory factor
VTPTALRSFRSAALLAAVVCALALAPYLIVWLTEPVAGCSRIDAWGPPAGFEYWNPDRVGVWSGWFIWAFVAAELGIFVPYTWIPISLVRVLRGRGDIPFNWLVRLFSSFIFSCGTTHAIVVLTIFRPWYVLELTLLGICAAVSNATALVLHRKVKFLIGLPPLEAVLRANEVLAARAGTLQADKEALEEKEAELQAALADLAGAVAEKDSEIEKNRRLVAELDLARDRAQERAQRAEGQAGEIAAQRDDAQRHADELRALNEELRRASDERAAASERIELQAAAIRELETPVTRIWPGVLLCPVVGPMDSRRAQRLTEAILGSVVQHSASVVILDLTGVTVVDTEVASALSYAAKAVQLIGAGCVITGIGGDVAMTMVKLDVGFGIETCRDVEQGLSLAMRRIKSRTSASP